MKKISFAVVTLLALNLAMIASAEEKDKKFHDAAFIAYEGTQKWPTADKAEVIKDFAVPIYIGLPAKNYKVLGRIYDPRKSGIGVVGRELAHIFSEKDRQRDVTDQAKYRGADAVLITKDEKVIKAFGLSEDDISSSSPLKDHKDKVTLAIKFE